MHSDLSGNLMKSLCLNNKKNPKHLAIHLVLDHKSRSVVLPIPEFLNGNSSATAHTGDIMLA